MAEIEIGEIVIKEQNDIMTVSPMLGRDVHLGISKREVRADFRINGEAQGSGNFGLLMEMHPELEAHCDAIRAYMKQEARRLLGD